MTVFPFVQSPTSPFQFQPTLDGAIYNASVPWLLFGARYYLSLVALDGTQVWYGAVPGSPTGVAILSLVWANGIARATTALPHGYKPGRAIDLTIIGCTPDAYNGLFSCMITGPSSFSYLLSPDPGDATVFGSAEYNVNMIGGVAKPDGTFFASTLVFRDPANQFEVSP